MRFEKAQDPVNTVRGLARAVELLEEISPGIRLVGGVADSARRRRRLRRSSCRWSGWNASWGATVERGGGPATFWRRLAFGVRRFEPGVCSVTVPSWRATKDISIKDDLVEEVGRMVGYGSITPQAPLVRGHRAAWESGRRFQHDVRNLFVDKGFTEVYNYSFLSEEAVRAFGFDPAAHIRVMNPIASRSGADAGVAAAGDLEERHGEQQESGELPAV